jgi:hypothetical protein
MKTICRLFALFITVACAGCAPEFGLELQVPALPEADKVAPGGADEASLRVKVGSFEDARAESTLVVVDGRDVRSVGAVGLPVKEAFERDFRGAGVRVVMRDAPVLEGEVVEWKARVLPGFPSSDAVANAKIKLVLKDSQYHVLYKGTFTGEATVTHPLLDESHVQDILGQAMGGAVEAAVNDDVLRSQLSRGRIE